jgi:hypothetical protein
METPLRADTRRLLSGIIYCTHCGSRLCYNYQRDARKRADGTTVYEYELYRCYRKLWKIHGVVVAYTGFEPMIPPIG